YFLCASLFCLFLRLLPRSTLFPYTTLFRSTCSSDVGAGENAQGRVVVAGGVVEKGILTVGRVFEAIGIALERNGTNGCVETTAGDRKSTRLNSSHQIISYAVFCLKKKK